MRSSVCEISGSGQCSAGIVLPLLAHAPRAVHTDSTTVERMVRTAFNFLSLDRLLVFCAVAQRRPLALRLSPSPEGTGLHDIMCVQDLASDWKALRLRLFLFCCF
jgi:hypothetical protein